MYTFHWQHLRPIWITAKVKLAYLSSVLKTDLAVTWLCHQSASKPTETTVDYVIRRKEVNFPPVEGVCRKFWWKPYLGSVSEAEQRELLWGAAEAWRGKQRSSDRHLFLTLHFLQVSSHTANATCRLLRACVCLPVYVPTCVCASVQGPGMRCWLNPWLSEKHARLPVPMTLNTHMAVLGKTNGRKMEYTRTAGTKKEEGRGGEETLNSSWGADSQTIPLSHGEGDLYIDFQPCCVFVCDITCRASQSCCRQGCLVSTGRYKGQSGSLVNQTIHQNRSSEEDTVVCGPGAYSDK